MSIRIPDDVLALVRSDMQKAFVRFVKTGKPDDDFRSFLDSNSDAQRAVECVLRGRLGAVERLGAVMSMGIDRKSFPDLPFSEVDESILLGQSLMDLASVDENARESVIELTSKYIRERHDRVETLAIVAILERLTTELRPSTGSYRAQLQGV